MHNLHRSRLLGYSVLYSPEPCQPQRKWKVLSEVLFQVPSISLKHYYIHIHCICKTECFYCIITVSFMVYAAWLFLDCPTACLTMINGDISIYMGFFIQPGSCLQITVPARPWRINHQEIGPTLTGVRPSKSVMYSTHNNAANHNILSS